ncbi:hypothetical protein DN051_40965 (plasmid) [Streptomyces cadmiisoli]|uniref:Transposase DDE domain-containing protein n=1 Tax=Streptomyces cadmiisoli TaxID=2184053 RepID=A0A2Z4JD04_9ACTN|nr:hypothetical protein DN051_40965 [Streptomyces cadmiisoli]
MPMLALTDMARLRGSRRMRLRLSTAAGQVAITGRWRIFRLARYWPWAHDITTALDRLAQLPNSG